MYGCDLTHTGRSPYVASPTGTLKWTRSVSALETLSTPVIGADGTIYVGGSDWYSLKGTAFALNADGSLKWSYKTGGEIDCPPAIGSDGTVYFGSWDGKIYALNPNGSLKWSFDSGELSSSPAIGPDGTIYSGSSSNDQLVALNPNGTLKWTYKTDGWVWSSPAIDASGTIYVSSYNSDTLYAVNPDGSLKWSDPDVGGGGSSAAIGSGGTIYVGGMDALNAVNPDGSLKWSFKRKNAMFEDASPAIGADGTIYIGCYDDKLYAVNPDGSLKWSYATGSAFPYESSPAIDASGTVFVGGSDSNLYAINADGTLKWSYPTAGIWSSPVIGSDGTVYLSSIKLEAFGGTPATPEATYLTIKTSATSARVGKQFILSGLCAPSPDLVGTTMHVDVKKPGKTYWSYSSNRVVYAGVGGAASWQYKYTLKAGMTKGTYQFRAVYPVGASYATTTSAVVKVVVK